jgi:4-diphosphocytidyl-2-C-methyl-D-erythritol kinase
VPAARVLAQAKVNLFLRVLARETSGYHQIETLFCRIALGDMVSVRATDGERSLRCTAEGVPEADLGPPNENLAWRAAEGYLLLAGWPGGFAIEIEKRIPVGSGLGGGSADAGAVLRALNSLNPSPVPATALCVLAGSLGADVLFLTQDVSPLALAWGRGDRMLTLPALPVRPCWLFCPPFGISTGLAYQWLSASPAPAVPSVLTPDGFANWSDIALLARNDFEDRRVAHRERRHYSDVRYRLLRLRDPARRPADWTER